MPRPSSRPLVLLHGDESFLVDEESRRTLEDWRKELVSEFGFESLDPAGLTAGRLRDAVIQVPFLDPYRVVAAMVRVARPDLGVIDSELRKLAAYQASGNRLDRDAIDELVVAGRQDDVFRLMDHLLPRPDAAAWRVLAGLLEREQPTLVAYRLARHLALVLDVKARQDRGESLPAVQSQMREHPFVVQRAYDAARTVSVEQLEAGLRALLTYEWEVKSGQIEAGPGLEAVLARL